MKHSESLSIKSALDWLASAGPLATTTVSSNEADKIMMQTGGYLMARGRLYNIECKRLSPKVYRLSLELANP